MMKSKTQSQYPNVPMSLPQIVQAIAKARDCSTETIARATTENAKSFLGLA